MRHYQQIFANNIDAVLVISAKNRHYFTQFQSTFGYLVLTPLDKLFITDARYYQMAVQLEEQGYKVMQCDANNSYIGILQQYFVDNNIKTVGFEDTELTVAEYTALSNSLSNVGLVSCGNDINTLRQVKDTAEIEHIVKAQSITDSAFADICRYIKSGMTEVDIAVELEYRMAKHGAEGLAFDTIIASGANTSKPHAHPTNKVVVEGDAITMDFGARYHGYCSDMTRTIFVGEPCKEMIEIYNIVAMAQQNAIDNAYTGMSGGELDSLAREVIKANGYGQYFVHSTGHSLGIDIHENPRASIGMKDLFLQNMICTVEPGIYVPDLGGVRIEDMILFQQDSVIDLTMSPKNIIIL